MSSITNGRLTLMAITNSADREALVDYLAGLQKNANRDRLAEMIGRLPLVLSRSISQEGARRIAAEMEKLGAKLCFSPGPGEAQETPRGQAVDPAVHQDLTQRPLDEALLNEAFSDERLRFPVSRSYRIGLVLVSLAMVLLPLLYGALVGGVAYLLCWHASSHLHVFHTMRSLREALFTYLAPLIVGGMVLLFLVKPLFAERAKRHLLYRVLPRDEPLLFAFLEKVCAAIGAPMPTSVRLNTQVNASAGFARGIRSFGGQDLELTIGLPLVRGLTVSEFAGVLAHEFGHFAQSSGMRLSYLVRSINHWFARVVYEKDLYDVRLELLSRSAGVQIGVFVWIARFFIWMGRRVLFLLMKTGQAVSCFMMRQMEFDADRYEVALVGAGVFESTSRKLRQLTAAHSMALEDLQHHWEEGRLVDSLPELVGLRFTRMPEKTKADICMVQDGCRTKPFDTHPSDADRIASARAAYRPAVFSWPTDSSTKAASHGAESTSPEATASRFEDAPPAGALFKDFEALSKAVTREHYRQVLNCAPGSRTLMKACALMDSQFEEQKNEEALERYFLGRFTPWIPLGVESKKVSAPVDPLETVQEIKELKERIRVRDFRHEELVREFLHLLELMSQTAGAVAFLDSGFSIDPRQFGLAGRTAGEVLNVERRHAEREKALLKEIGAIQQLYVERLMSGLELLQGVSGEALPDEIGRMRKDVGVLLAAMEALEFQLPLLREVQREQRALVLLAHLIPNNVNNEALMDTARQRMDALRKSLGFLRRNLSDHAYPFDHARHDMSLGRFMVEYPVEECGMEELLLSAERATERMLRTYSRLAARLARSALEAERIMGLAPA
jgi:Zn-dependent protease with chaperone function